MDAFLHFVFVVRTTKIAVENERSDLPIKGNRFKSTRIDTGGRGRTDTPEGTRF